MRSGVPLNLATVDGLGALPPDERFVNSLDYLDLLEELAVEVRQHRANAIADLRAGNPPDTQGRTWDDLVTLACAGQRRPIRYQTIQQWARQGARG